MSAWPHNVTCLCRLIIERNVIALRRDWSVPICLAACLCGRIACLAVQKRGRMSAWAPWKVPWAMENVPQPLLRGCEPQKRISPAVACNVRVLQCTVNFQSMKSLKYINQPMAKNKMHTLILLQHNT